MTRSSRNPSPAYGALSFVSDAAQVVSLRLMLIGSGSPAGFAEAKSMVSEKVAALMHVQWKLVTGSYGLTSKSMADGVYNHYARIVRANRKRLSLSQ